jgi:hypothetical protein
MHMLKRIIIGTSIAAAGWAAYYAANRWWSTWGRDPEEAALALPGDGLVPDPLSVDTRGIEIAAPPSAVWPWLVQMGYGRAGWYSYDRLDMRGRSADEIHPEWQTLAVGDLLPTDPGGGFVVRELDPERALVVFIDTDLAVEQRGSQGAGVAVSESPGLAATGRFAGRAMPPRFAASWAFVLEPLGSDRTRLVERVRFGADAATSGSRLLGPAMGFGVFVMMQRQMLGIRDRAERATFGASAALGAPGGPVPVMEPAAAPSS